MLIRKGRKHQYFIDKINPFVSESLNYNSENFIGSENMFSNFKECSNDSIEINTEKEIKMDSETKKKIKGTKFFESETCLQNKKKQNLFLKDLQKRRFSQFKNTTKKETKLFDFIKFQEDNFVKNFLKKKKIN